ncbi:MAG: NADH-quinone oxidoreductase subunit I [Chloroflexi bacterium]|nr:NADH-quinone oxidoreductase subunit I [Chloroflexota bacterium]
MIGTFKGLVTNLFLAFKKPVTVQYPWEHAPLAPRYMGFPVLTWDGEVGEPFCTGCLVCARVCPTDCITVTMKDNPKAATGESHRRKIVEDFHLNTANCIVCGLCVEYCNFDAIIMSDLHEEGATTRGDLVWDLARLLEEGKKQQMKGWWSPPAAKKSERRATAPPRAAAPTAEEAAPSGVAAVAAPQESLDPRVVEARRKAAELRAKKAAERGEVVAAPVLETPSVPQAPGVGASAEEGVDPRVVEARRKAAELRAKKAAERAAQQGKEGKTEERE